MNGKRFLSFGLIHRTDYISPFCKLLPLDGNEFVCVSDYVTVDDYIINENEMDW